jgi:hypothetical protein
MEEMEMRKRRLAIVNETFEELHPKIPKGKSVIAIVKGTFYISLTSNDIVTIDLLSDNPNAIKSIMDLRKETYILIHFPNEAIAYQYTKDFDMILSKR